MISQILGLFVSSALLLPAQSLTQEEIIISKQEEYIKYLEEQNESLHKELEDIGFEHLEQPITIYPKDQPSSFKSFMDYRMITDKTSPQWKIRQEGYTLPNGLRASNGRVHIALGNKYANVGERVDIHLKTGKVIYGIVSDSKGNRYYHKEDGSTIEFLVNSDLIPYDWRLDKGLDELYNGYIEKIEKENLK